MANQREIPTHFIRYDYRVAGWVVISKTSTRRLVVTRPRTANAADTKRMEFNKAVASGRVPLYENISKILEIPDKNP